MIKSFLEPQVLFTVGLTAGASLVKQLSQDGGNHLFYSACFLKTGRDKSLNSKSSGPRIFSIPRKGMQYHAATRWEAWKKKSCMPDSVPPPYSPFMLPELETATKIRPNSMRSGRDRTSSKTQWDFMCKQEASWWRELLPCQRSLLSLPHPRNSLKRESTFSCLTPYQREGVFLSTVSSVSPAASWLQRQHTMRQSHLILQYHREERFYQIAWKDCSLITTSYLASLEGSDLFAWSGIHCRPSISNKESLALWQPTSETYAESCWSLMETYRKEFQTHIYWEPTKLNALSAGKAEDRHGLGKKMIENW